MAYCGRCTNAGSQRNLQRKLRDCYEICPHSNSKFPSQKIFVRDSDAPADLASMNGYIIDGRVHAPVTLTNEERAFGGHLEERTSLFTFANITIGIFKDGIDLSRVDDKTYRKGILYRI